MGTAPGDHPLPVPQGGKTEEAVRSGTPADCAPDVEPAPEPGMKQYCTFYIPKADLLFLFLPVQPPLFRSRLLQLKADLEHDNEVGASNLWLAEQALASQRKVLLEIQQAADRVRSRLNQSK